MALSAGTRLGPYELLAAIGAGGMGEVYRARDTRLHRDVAIKVLPASVAADPERRARLEREAQAIAALSHPNVLAVFDTGTHDPSTGSGQAVIYVVTELLEGETLRERLIGGALPVRKAIDIGVQIARGLAAAHDKQLIHRDLKPENVFLLDDGRVKILDFGLARHVPAGAGATETVAAATDPGTVLGTVGYMAPEQVRGQAIDARADLFAFGAVTYEMLTGQRAFRRDTAAETMTAILREDPPELTQLRADLPPALDRIVRHCLEKNLSERFQSAHDVAFALDSLSGSAAPTTTMPVPTGAAAGGTGWRWKWAVGLAAITLAVVATAWFIATRSRQSENAASTGGAPIIIGTATQVTAEDGLEIDPALSPEGKLLAYAAGTATHMRIYIRPVAGGRTFTLSEDRGAFEFQPRWSPDSSQILYLTRAGAFVAPALGGVAQRVVSGAIGAAAWAPDSKRLAIARGSALSIVQLDGSGERSLGTSSQVLHSCDWSRDDWIACASGNRAGVAPGGQFGNIAPSGIVVARVTGGLIVDVTDRMSLNLSPVWSPDSRHLYFVSNRQGPSDIYVLDIQNDGRPRSEPQRVSTGLGVQSIAFSATGDRLAYVTYSSLANIFSLPIPSSGTVDTSSAREVTSGNQTVEAMRVSRDRQWLLYDAFRQLNHDIFARPLAGGSERRVTTEPDGDFAPDLSRQGEVAYHSYRSGLASIFIKPLYGGPLVQATSSDIGARYPIWSPDGSALAFAGPSRGLSVMRRNPSGNWSAPVLVRRDAGSRGSWLADGRFLAYSQGGVLEVIPADGGSPQVVYTPAPDSADPRVESVVCCSDDGRTLYFKSHDAEGRASIWAVPVTGGTPQLRVRFSDLSRTSSRPDFAVGAGQFFFTLENRQADIFVAEVKQK